MRKLNGNDENPIDNVLIDISDYLCPFFKSLNFTPNGITTLSLIFGLLSVYFLYKGKLYLFALTYFVSYYFDVLDGHYARKYNMTSDIGCLYDHIKDVSVILLIMVVLCYNNWNNKKNLIKFLINLK